MNSTLNIFTSLTRKIISDSAFVLANRFRPFRPRWLYWIGLHYYLLNRPRLRAQMGFEIDRAQDSQYGIFLFHDNWPAAWFEQLLDYYIAFDRNEPLSLTDALPLVFWTPDPGYHAYNSIEAARSAYLAQVAHVLWLDATGGVPWRLEEWSDHELSYLLSSKVCFDTWRTGSNQLYYIVWWSSRSEATENILQDPRVGFLFMQQEPEQGLCLVGSTPSETGQKLTGWFHDYLWHNPDLAHGFDTVAFFRDHPLLADRLKRHPVQFYGKDLYVTPGGCGSASSLFADLMRSVNIPVRKVNNQLEDFDKTQQSHSGLVFDWQGGSGNGRYLSHTDDIYTSGYFKDPASIPPTEERGPALWNNVWLEPGEFGRHFSYEDPSQSQFFAKASIEQKEKYWYMRSWLACTNEAVIGLQYAITHPSAKQENIDALMSKGCTEAEALNCWETAELIVRAYGNGDLALGCQTLLDGTNSRHQRWCARTGKC